MRIKNSLVTILKRLRPNWLGRWLFETPRHYLHDLLSYLKYSATIPRYKDQLRYQGRLIARYHVIEKALSLKYPRAGFGAEKVKDLLLALHEYEKRFGFDRMSVVALNVLFAYHNFNLEHGVDNTTLYEELCALRAKVPSSLLNETRGGVKLITRQEIEQATTMDFERFVSSRYSVRHFAEKGVELEVVRRAVSMALKTPSVCNRQTCRVYVFSTEDAKRKILSYQNGNSGFGEFASVILLVTSELGYFTGYVERNEPFIDGGMFAMSLVYALHSLGLGTCCLNLCNNYSKNHALRKVAHIGDSEALIMMIAVGHLPATLQVAQSPRRDLEEVMLLRDVIMEEK